MSRPVSSSVGSDAHGGPVGRTLPHRAHGSAHTLVTSSGIMNRVSTSLLSSSASQSSSSDDGEIGTLLAPGVPVGHLSSRPGMPSTNGVMPRTPVQLSGGTSYTSQQSGSLSPYGGECSGEGLSFTFFASPREEFASPITSAGIARKRSSGVKSALHPKPVTPTRLGLGIAPLQARAHDPRFDSLSSLVDDSEAASSSFALRTVSPRSAELRGNPSRLHVAQIHESTTGVTSSMRNSPSSARHRSPFKHSASSGPRGPSGHVLPSSASRVGASGGVRTPRFGEPGAGASRALAFQLGRVIGSGGFGTVYQAVLPDGTLVAVKEMKLEMNFKSIDREVRTMSSLPPHPNCIGYLGSRHSQYHYYIIMDYISGGNIQSLRNSLGRFRESVFQRYAYMILQGLQHLHRNGIIHRDIKGANVLLDERGCAKIADFGCCKDLELGTTTVGGGGTPLWMAPEVCRGEEATEKSDVWSFGCLCLEMTNETGRPWNFPSHMNIQGLAYAIGSAANPPSVPRDLSSYAQDFIRSCLLLEPADRPDVSSLLGHPFFDIDYTDDWDELEVVVSRERSHQNSGSYCAGDGATHDANKVSSSVISTPLPIPPGQQGLPPSSTFPHVNVELDSSSSGSDDDELPPPSKDERQDLPLAQATPVEIYVGTAVDSDDDDGTLDDIIAFARDHTTASHVLGSIPEGITTSSNDSWREARSGSTTSSANFSTSCSISDASLKVHADNNSHGATATFLEDTENGNPNDSEVRSSVLKHQHESDSAQLRAEPVGSLRPRGDGKIERVQSSTAASMQTKRMMTPPLHPRSFSDVPSANTKTASSDLTPAGQLVKSNNPGAFRVAHRDVFHQWSTARQYNARVASGHCPPPAHAVANVGTVVPIDRRTRSAEYFFHASQSPSCSSGVSVSSDFVWHTEGRGSVSKGLSSTLLGVKGLLGFDRRDVPRSRRTISATRRSASVSTARDSSVGGRRGSRFGKLFRGKDN